MLQLHRQDAKTKYTVHQCFPMTKNMMLEFGETNHIFATYMEDHKVNFSVVVSRENELPILLKVFYHFCLMVTDSEPRTEFRCLMTPLE